ncbi:hypothetical protein V1460_36125 [Streptomyces sp. SCSIO 30461]|uniref:hypothetical protein n=1 Tax=Streptomyces sp. SCSIO 30461 TaxID=3118085 RepID=UPI0030D1B05E
MTKKPDGWNDPRWRLLLVVPLLIYVVVEDDAIIRGLLASALALGAFQYGWEMAKRAQAKAAEISDSDV